MHKLRLTFLGSFLEDFSLRWPIGDILRAVRGCGGTDKRQLRRVTGQRSLLLRVLRSNEEDKVPRSITSGWFLTVNQLI